MTAGTNVEVSPNASLFVWAAEKLVDLVITQAVEGEWASFRSKLLGYDQKSGAILIARPEPANEGQRVDVSRDAELGVAFRRGHKKCLFVSRVSEDLSAVADAVPGTLVLAPPTDVRSVQRRAYQRVVIPSHRFIAAKIWDGGLPGDNGVSYPVSSGRVSNVSVGGVMVDVRSDQNPRLQVGDLVGIEVTQRPGMRPLLVEAQYRHCVMHSDDRLGLGFQFVGLEHDLPGRSTLEEVKLFASAVRRGV
ncbi:MAG: PilZ domain-containing protein [Phycisphaerales bacterium]|nr:PilZ domain-containing protein [Phycisphaerales bacterium]MCB9864824.1 PilZ domain-containing protein [Phycisphaerales bacterium]